MRAAWLTLREPRLWPHALLQRSRRRRDELYLRGVARPRWNGQRAPTGLILRDRGRATHTAFGRAQGGWRREPPLACFRLVAGVRVGHALRHMDRVALGCQTTPLDLTPSGCLSRHEPQRA